MLSSSESDPFTTAPPPSPPRPSRSDAQTLIHGFPQERHSFRNVDRVRQRFINGKGFVQDHVPDGSGSGTAHANGKKRKLGNRNASGSGSGSGSVSATESAHVAASTRTVMWEKKKDDGGAIAETNGLPYLKTAKQMESASVGRIMPSSPTGKGRRRRRTFAGYQQKNLPLPHIDLMSKLVPRSSSVSPAIVFQKQPVKEQQQSVSKTQQQLVLHRLSRKRHSSAHSQSRRSSLPQSVSRTIPNKILAGPLTTTNTDDISNGISITQLSARSLELLIENGLSLVFKKLEMNHGFANETVKRAWLRCNGDIEATDGLLLTMRKAAEKAEASFLNEWDESGSFFVEEEQVSSDEEEERRRVVKRPRWSEPHISPQSDSIDSRYAPRQLSSDHEFIYPQEDGEYTPPVGTKAEMYRRLTEQGRHDEAQKFLIYSMTPRKSGFTPREMPSSGRMVKKLVLTGVGTGRRGVSEMTAAASRLTIDKSVNRGSTESRKRGAPVPSPTDTIPTRLISSGTSTESRHPSITHQHDDEMVKSSGGRVSKKAVERMEEGEAVSNETNAESRNPSVTRQHDDDDDGTGGRVSKIVHETTSRKMGSGKVVHRVEEEETMTKIPSIRKPVSTQSRNPPISTKQHNNQTHSLSKTQTQTQTQTPHDNNTAQPPNSNPSPPPPTTTTTAATTNKTSSPSSNSDGEQDWTPSDDEMLINSKDKSQVDLLSSKYGDHSVLKRFIKLVKMKG